MRLKIKYIYLIFVTLSMSSLLIGCTGLSKKVVYRLTLIDQKIQKLEQSLSNLDASTKNLVRFIEELSDKTAVMEKNYSRVHTELDELNSKMESKDSLLESAVSDTQKTIEDLERKLSEIEESKTELQKQIAELQGQRHNITSSNVERPTEAAKEEDAKAEGTSASQKKEVLQKLLDEAQELYRNENYKGAIGKWQEALAIDPESLEAKLNMEIAKGRIKSLSEKEK